MKTESQIVRRAELVHTLDDARKAMSGLSVTQLKDELRSCLEVTVTQLVRLSAIIRELEDRGESLAEIQLGIMTYLRRIAYGQMLPELVVRYQGMPGMLRRVASMPIPDQEKIASDKPVKVIDVIDGEVSGRLVPIQLLTGDEVKQVFARDHLRTDDEQAVWLKQKKRERFARSTVKGVALDVKRGGIEVSGERVFIPLQQLSEFVSKLVR